MEKLQDKFGKDVEFMFVYTQEAHPDNGSEKRDRNSKRPGGWKIAGNKIKINDHKKYKDRVDAAKKLRKAGKDDWRVVVDDMKNTLQKTWGNLPNCAFLINPQGEIAQKWAWVRNSTPENAGSPDQDTTSAYELLKAKTAPVTIATDKQLYLRQMREGWVKYSLTGTGSETVTWAIGEKENTVTRSVGEKSEDIKLEDPDKEAAKTESKTLKIGEVELPCTVILDGKNETWYCGWLPGDGIAKVVEDGKVVRELKDAGIEEGESMLKDYKPE